MIKVKVFIIFSRLLICLGGRKMGLFTSKKNLCPVCGEPTPKLLATKVEGTPICKVCAGKVDLPDGMMNQMSVENFVEYIAFYDRNESLRESFQETYKYSQGFLKSDIAIDLTNRLFRLRNAKDALCFEASNLKSFRILEDEKVLYENGGNTLVCKENNTAEIIKGMYALVEQFRVRRQQYEMMERMQKREEEAAKQRGETYHTSHIPQPFFEGNEPFQNFYIELELEHPYWDFFRGEVKGTKFSITNPEVGTYLCEYQNAVDKLHELAVNLMQLIHPRAQESFSALGMAPHDTVVTRTAPQVASVSGDSVEEIKKYKELLDAGIITQEEFTAKKRQLMGL